MNSDAAKDIVTVAATTATNGTAIMGGLNIDNTTMHSDNNEVNNLDLPQLNASSSSALLCELVAPLNEKDEDFASKQFQNGNWSSNVTVNDVLCGRGGLTNNHPGNVFFRTLVRNRQETYLFASKRDKALVAHGIVDVVRSLKPPGRFLKKDKKNFWIEIGNKKAREKTSQALREKAPELMEMLQKDFENQSTLKILDKIGKKNTYVGRGNKKSRPTHVKEEEVLQQSVQKEGIEGVEGHSCFPQITYQMLDEVTNTGKTELQQKGYDHHEDLAGWQ